MLTTCFLRFQRRIPPDLFEARNDLLWIDAVLEKEHTTWDIFEILFADVEAGGDGDNHVRAPGAFEFQDFLCQIIWPPKADNL